MAGLIILRLLHLYAYIIQVEILKKFPMMMTKQYQVLIQELQQILIGESFGMMVLQKADHLVHHYIILITEL